MSRKFAVALVAATLIAGPAFAQNYDTTKPAAPAAQSRPASAASTAPAKTGMTVKHAKMQKKHRNGVSHQARHAKPAKAHQVSTGKSGNRS